MTLIDHLPGMRYNGIISALPLTHFVSDYPPPPEFRGRPGSPPSRYAPDFAGRPGSPGGQRYR
jgi:hypothetical protein